MRAVFSLMVLSGVALAADPARGSQLFNDRCAGCHTAQRDTKERGGKPAPDLVKRLKTKDGALLNAWILEPSLRGKLSACDTSAIVAEPDTLSDLWAFLQTRVDAPPPPRAERRTNELSTARVSAWRTRNRGER